MQSTSHPLALTGLHSFHSPRRVWMLLYHPKITLHLFPSVIQRIVPRLRLSLSSEHTKILKSPSLRLVKISYLCTTILMVSFSDAFKKIKLTHTLAGVLAFAPAEIRHLIYKFAMTSKEGQFQFNDQTEPFTPNVATGLMRVKSVN